MRTSTTNVLAESGGRTWIWLCSSLAACRDGGACRLHERRTGVRAGARERHYHAQPDAIYYGNFETKSLQRYVVAADAVMKSGAALERSWSGPE
jgi:hypothetical protein